MSASRQFNRWVGAVVAATAMGCTTPTDPMDTGSASEAMTGEATTTTTGGSTSGATGIQTVTGDETDTGVTTTGEPGTGTGSSTTGVDVCAGPVAALAAMIPAGEACEVLVHLDAAAVPVGFAITCGTTGTTWTLGKELGMATECCADGPEVYPGLEDAPLYVLHYINVIGPDGVALLSNHTGQVVLDALTGEGAPGPFAVPASWIDPDALATGMGCGDPGFSLAKVLSFDLGQGGAPLAGADLTTLAAAIGETALGPALAQASTFEPAAVVRYAPQDGQAAHDFVLLEVTGN